MRETGLRLIMSSLRCATFRRLRAEGCFCHDVSKNRVLFSILKWPWNVKSIPWIARSMGCFLRSTAISGWKKAPDFLTHRGKNTPQHAADGKSRNAKSSLSDVAPFRANTATGEHARKKRILRVKKKSRHTTIPFPCAPGSPHAPPPRPLLCPYPSRPLPPRTGRQIRTPFEKMCRT